MRTLGTATILALGLTCAIAATAQTPQTPQPQSGQDQAITVTGCVQSEGTVLKRPTASGNVGMADEFVLTNSMLKTSAAEPAPATPPTEPSSPTATSGATSVGKVYRVTGDQEAQLKAHVGHKVEISGRFKSDADARRELGAMGTSGKSAATAAEPTATNTPEISIISFRMLSETCGG